VILPPPPSTNSSFDPPCNEDSLAFSSLDVLGNDSLVDDEKNDAVVTPMQTLTVEVTMSGMGVGVAPAPQTPTCPWFEITTSDPSTHPLD
jgi:hypothetical protein